MEWVVSFKLVRSDKMLIHRPDLTKTATKNEIRSWLSDLGFEVRDVRID
tara:strand:+ start:662 stop:808 length:147 start_codon:yes stop_codon:yes gene_type:complete